MSQKKGFDRREFITKGGLAVAGATLAVSGLGAILSGCDNQEPQDPNGNGNGTDNGNGVGQIEVPEYPWKWTKIDPDVVAERAYVSYKEDG